MRRILIGLALLPLLAGAQFDSGGGPAWESFKLNPKTKVSLNFKNANANAVVDFLSKNSGITIVRDPSLAQTTVTVSSAKPVSLNDAFQILSSTLSMKGFTIAKQGNLLVIRGQNNGRGGGSSPFGNMTPEQIQQMMGNNSDRPPQTELRVFPITYANASQLAKVLNDIFAPNGPQQGASPFQFMQRGGRFQRPNFGAQNTGTEPQVRASSDDFSNSVIVNGPSSMMDQVSEIIQKLDKQTEDPETAQVYHLQYATASDLAPTVQNVLTSNAPKGRGGVSGQEVSPQARFQQMFRFGGNTAAGFGTVVADDRTNSLVVTATPENQTLVAKVIADLDTEVKVEDTTFVFPLENARADDVASLFQQAFGTRTGLVNNRVTNNTSTANRRQTVPGSRTGTNNNSSRPPSLGGDISPDPANGSVPIALNPDGSLETNVGVDLQQPSDLMASVAAQRGGGGQFFRGFGGGSQNSSQDQQMGRDAQGRPVNIRDLQNQITVIPDQNTNSLIVVTTPENAQLVQTILDQLDRIPQQVMIQTMIIETNLDSSDQFGIEWKFAQPKAFGNKGTTGQLSNDFGIQSANPALQGFKYTLTGGDLGIFLNALKQETKFQVLSTPRIFTSNNSQAQINISQSIPYILSTTVDVNTGAQSFNYSFEDVGIILTVTPHITANGYVTMDVDQTANDLQGYTTFNAPIVNQRTASTTVSVKDGDTIILGGIIRNNVTSTVKKIPLLGDIPLLGQLFRSTTKDNQKTELMVFLTPHVVRNPEEARGLREDEQKQMSPPAQKILKNAIPPAIGDGHKSPPPPKS